jgi:4-methylaminobutanoate oxidase (formaldehyde-forming)
MLDANGGIRCDLTVSRLAPDRYYLVTGTGFRTHDQAWIKRHLPAGPDAVFADVTERYGCLALMGPNARDILAATCRDDTSNEAFPYLTCRRIDIAGVAVTALRVTYVGELGYELHIPVADMDVVYDALWRSGATRGLVDAGYRAIESLRLEKGYRAWGADINADCNPFEAGLGFAVKLDGGIDFLGRDALIEQTRRPLRKILTTFTTDDPAIMLFGRETIFRNGEQVGYLTSGGFGHTIGKPIGLGYVRAAAGLNRGDVLAGAYELEVASLRVKAQAHLAPLYDPRGAKVRA